jgi:invasion protein IalB
MGRLRFAIGAMLLPLFLAAPTAARAEARVGEKFGDWTFECQAIADGKTDCALTQILVNKQTNQPVLKFMLTRGKKADDVELKALIPLGIDIQAGVSGSIDEKPTLKFVLETCVQPGCLASVKVKGALLDSMKAGKALNISFTQKSSGNKLSFSGSLKGLSDGVAAAGY